MATKNLSLDHINSSDYVSPATINENMTKLDVLGVDFVVTSGYSGEWWFRKWKSGRAECGVDNKKFGKLVLTPWGGGGFITKELTFGAYPFSFKIRPFTSIVFEGDSLHTTRACDIIQKHSTSTTASPYFNINDASTTEMDAMCGIFVCGRCS